MYYYLLYTDLEGVQRTQLPGPGTTQQVLLYITLREIFGLSVGSDVWAGDCCPLVVQNLDCEEPRHLVSKFTLFTLLLTNVNRCRGSPVTPRHVHNQQQHGDPHPVVIPSFTENYYY